jgi:hypothetical protein
MIYDVQDKTNEIHIRIKNKINLKTNKQKNEPCRDLIPIFMIFQQCVAQHFNLKEF